MSGRGPRALEADAPLAPEAEPREPAPVAGGARGRRTRVLSRKALRRVIQAAGELDLEDLAGVEAWRPRTRADCLDAPRPCPFVGCKHHLFLDVTRAGSLCFNFPGAQLEDLEETCALDVADRGGVTLERVGELVNVTRERIRQVETRALLHLKAKVEP